jgi:hypothetical protein
VLLLSCVYVTVASALLQIKLNATVQKSQIKPVNRNCSGHHCPQLLELADGDFAGVGLDITDEAIPAMPPGPGVGPKERVIRIPRRVMIAARADIPDS